MPQSHSNWINMADTAKEKCIVNPNELTCSYPVPSLI